ncbi:MAG: integrase arm-type DNA-binding domain-containing protein, partial [Alphaproteobacteria bacterium]|nr:integrase arm-type DNA-binding domain-containing protein [Alphaproteobacteria bacterium]
MPKLTKTAVESVEPGSKDIILRDSQIKGFCCKITPKGKRVYLLYYRTRDHQQRRPSIGAHGSITCERAREIAREWMGQVAGGDDPSADRSGKRKAPTMADLAKRYMDEYAPTKKPRSAENDERLWRLHILPALGRKKAHAITQEDVAKLHASMRDNP